MKLGFPSACYHTRLLCRGTAHDTTRATFQMRLYRGRSRRSGRRSNTADTSVMYAQQVRGRPPAQEHLGFHPASAYKYSGERAACKVRSCVRLSELRHLLVVWSSGIAIG